MQIPRAYQDLEKHLKENKVLILFGPRQVGKTTLLQNYLKNCPYKYKLESGDNLRVQNILGSQDFKQIKEYCQGYELIAVDEAQRIPGIGMGLKILVDQVPGIRVITTGSSSFEVAGQIGEPLTGRKVTLTLYPISQLELAAFQNPGEMKENLEEALIFGGYPDVVTAGDRKKKARILEELVQSYLLKDILELERVKSSKKVLDLLRLLAFQAGQQTSLSELGQQIGIDYKTVGRYLDLFEKSFVIASVRGFSHNLRKEISKKCKYYFYDTGIRNAIIANFNGLELRNDTGALWENFLFMERLKKRTYHEIFANYYFWRTWEGQEIDLVEEREGRLFGYEFKRGKKRPAKGSREWQAAYPEASMEVIDRENYLSFIT